MDRGYRLAYLALIGMTCFLYSDISTMGDRSTTSPSSYRTLYSVILLSNLDLLYRKI